MEQSQFEHVKTQVAAATAGQILELEDVIRRAVSQQFIEMALARRTRQTLQTRSCPHCHGNNIALHGKDQNGRQRFKCRSCCRSYNIMTGTPMARARKPEKWGLYLRCMTEHMSVRKIVASGIGVHQVTAWRWRHRFLQAAANDTAAVLSGVVETAETFFALSFKGSRGWKTGQPPEMRSVRRRAWRGGQRGLPRQHVPVLTALDNSGDVFQAILQSVSAIAAALEGRIAAGSVLCSDGSAAYGTVADNAKAEHYIVFAPGPTVNTDDVNPVVAPARRAGRLGLGRVHDHHRRLKYLINEQCRGVATKYLWNYLGWHRAMTRPGFDGTMLLARALA